MYRRGATIRHHHRRRPIGVLVGVRRRNAQCVLNIAVSTYNRQLLAREPRFHRRAQMLAVFGGRNGWQRLLDNVHDQFGGADLAENGQHVERRLAHATLAIGGGACGSFDASPKVEVGAGKGHQCVQDGLEGVFAKLYIE